MQLLTVLLIVWTCISAISFIATIFSDDGKISTLVESVLWGTLCCCAISYGGTFAFVMGIILAALLGINAMYHSTFEPKPTVIIHLPMCILFIIGVCQYTY